MELYYYKIMDASTAGLMAAAKSGYEPCLAHELQTHASFGFTVSKT